VAVAVVTEPLHQHQLVVLVVEVLVVETLVQVAMVLQTLVVEVEVVGIIHHLLMDLVDLV
jgi:hypothetical protein